MTIITNAFSTYSQLGAKEDFANVINTITPDETPFYSQLPKFTVKQRLHQWQTDSLMTPIANAQLEGDAVSAAVSSATSVLDNICQISYKAVAVSDTAQATETYGRANDYDYIVAKRGKELKLDIELALLRNTAKVSVSTAGTATARVTAGLMTWITNTVNGTAPAGTGLTTATAASATALTYEFCASAMQLAFNSGGNPTVMMTTPTLKRKFSGLAFSSTPSTADVRYNLSKPAAAVAIGTVEQWLSDFGTVDVVVNRQMARQTADTALDDTVFFLDMDYARLGMLQPIEVIPLAKTGLADQAVIRTEYVLEVGAPSAHAQILAMT